MVDRTTRVLLALIAVALWGLLLKPVLTPTPVYAQEGVMAVNIAQVGGHRLYGVSGRLPVEVEGQVEVQQPILVIPLPAP